MTRVLLVSDHYLDYDNRAAVARLIGAAAPRMEITHVPLSAAGAMPHMVRRVASLERDDRTDVIHAVGPSSLLAVLPCGCQPIIYSPPADDPLLGLARLRWISKARRVTVACISEAHRREFLRNGIARDATRVVRSAPTLTGAPRLAREEIGLKQDQRVVVAIGESSRRSNHYLAAWAAVILYFFDRKYRFVVWGRGPVMDPMRRYMTALRQPGFSVVAEDAAGRSLEWESVAQTADVALFTAARPSGLYAARVCEALGVPIVAAPTSISRELDRSNAAFSLTSRARIIAAAAHKLAESETRTGKPPIASPATAEVLAWKRVYDDAIVGRMEDAIAAGQAVLL
jgi:hypothetical protein